MAGWSNILIRTRSFVIAHFNHCGLISRSLLRKELFPDLLKSVSFPNASIGNPGETATGPPIKTFGLPVPTRQTGGDAFGINSHRYVLIPRQAAAGSSFRRLPGLSCLGSREKESLSFASAF
jgi:hypothetical protein